MTPAQEPRSKENGRERDPPPLAEALRAIEEYANDLREIIKKLRKQVK